MMEIYRLRLSHAWHSTKVSGLMWCAESAISLSERILSVGNWFNAAATREINR